MEEKISRYDESDDRSKYIKLVVTAGLIIILDQIAKALILKGMPLYDSVPVIPGFFNITHVHNPGGAFGVFAGGSILLRKVLFLFISSLAAILVLYLYIKTPKDYPFLALGFALIFGGAVGNLIDRIRFGTVVDFLDFHVSGLHWPAFNVADSAITVGVSIFIIHLLFKKLPD